jgi:hypothetical protein
MANEDGKAGWNREVRRVKATQRMENMAFYPDGSPKEEGSWVVEAGEYVPVDHPAVALHPTHFEGV